MKKFKANLVLSGLLALVVIALVACGAQPTPAPADAPAATEAPAAEEPQEEVTMELWVQGDWTGDVDGVKKLIPEFEADNPGIKVNVTEIPYDEQRTKILSALATGAGLPDVTYVYGDWIPPMVAKGWLEPVPASLWTPAQMNEKFYPGMVDFGLGTDGTPYAIPMEFTTEWVGFLVNMKLYEECGYTEADLPTTWDEIIEQAGTCVKLDDSGAMAQAGLFTMWFVEAYQFQSLILQLGNGTYDQMYDESTRKFTFDTPDGKEALQWWTDLPLKYGLSDYEFIHLWEGMLQGRGTMALIGPWYVPIFEEAQPDVENRYLPLPPAFGDTPYFLIRGGYMYVVPAEAEHKDAAWKWIEWITETENYARWLEASGTLSGIPSIYDYEPYTSSPMGQVVLPIEEQILPYAVRPPNLSDTNALHSDCLTPVIEKVYRGESTVDEAVLEMNECANEMEDAAWASLE
jgi:multiple sugar transport system substrate-binding protein